MPQGGIGDACPFTVGHEVVPSQHEGIDAEIFDECLKSRCFGTSVFVLSEEVKGAGVGGECVGTLKVGADISDRVIPNGIWLNGQNAVAHDKA